MSKMSKHDKKIAEMKEIFHNKFPKYWKIHSGRFYREYTSETFMIWDGVYMISFKNKNYICFNFNYNYFYNCEYCRELPYSNINTVCTHEPDWNKLYENIKKAFHYIVEMRARQTVNDSDDYYYRREFYELKHYSDYIFSVFISPFNKNDNTKMNIKNLRTLLKQEGIPIKNIWDCYDSDQESQEET